MFTNFKHLVLVSLFVQALAGCGTETFGACESIDGGQSADTSCFKRLFENKEDGGLMEDMTAPPVKHEQKPSYASVKIPMELKIDTCNYSFQIFAPSSGLKDIRVSESQAKMELMEPNKPYCKKRTDVERYGEILCTFSIRAINDQIPKKEVEEVLAEYPASSFIIKVDVGQRQLNLSSWKSYLLSGSRQLTSSTNGETLELRQVKGLGDIQNFEWTFTEVVKCDGKDEAPSFAQQPAVYISSLRLE